MALSALNFAQSDMALVGEVNEFFDLVDDLPRYLATFCDVFLLK